MKQKHVTQLFLKWQDGSLGAPDKERVEEHLNRCPACQQYFQTWANIFKKPDPNILPRLSADPYLPTRIVSGEIRLPEGENSKPTSFGVRWSFATILTLIGLSTGAILGISTSDRKTYSDQDIARAYYEAVTQQENQYNLEQLLGLENGGSDED